MNPISHICCYENSTLVDVLNIYEIDAWYKKQNKIILTFTEEYTKPI